MPQHFKPYEKIENREIYTFLDVYRNTWARVSFISGETSAPPNLQLSVNVELLGDYRDGTGHINWVRAPKDAFAELLAMALHYKDDLHKAAQQL